METQDSGINKEEVDNNSLGRDDADDSNLSTVLLNSDESGKEIHTVAPAVVTFVSNSHKQDLWLHQSKCKKLEAVEMEEIPRTPLVENWDQDDRRESGVDVSCDDTSHLISHDEEEDDDNSGTGDSLNFEDAIVNTRTKVYNSSTRFCQTRTSIVLSKVVILLICIVLLAVGAVLAGIFRHNPTGCDLEESLNCSSICLNLSIDVHQSFDNFTTESSTVVIWPTSSSAYVNTTMETSDCMCELMPTPMALG